MRTATRQDLPRIVEIYNAAIPGRMATADTEPVSVQSREAWFAAHGPKRPLRVLEAEGRVVGWLSFRDFYGRPAYSRTAEIGLYLDPAHQGRGHGRTLLAEALTLAPSLELDALLAFVFAHNAASLALFERQGFVRWGLLPDVAELDGVRRSLAILGLRL
ncbi:GNAT family N-acetyltransferase [Acidihalobacter prosperus]|uniref:Phosphinothricin acetyltransferase n=1 Tax=Acidihalobacter prosperus TaxID=160660 RepID=A0A1A6C6A3_9GAMM|nr:GNAT family N-acetyltransferase [Acidihalobacter prosperus]OBS10093.1 phosphinothricin acetyltransferase [Acidihalobacter prosperus]